MEQTELEKYRNEIDKIDLIIAESFERRMEIVTMIAEYKQKNGIAIFDPQREEKMLEKNVGYIKNVKLKGYYAELLKKLLEVSKRYQQELKK